MTSNVPGKNRFKLNLISNFVGSGWSAIMQFAFIPIYINYLGIEAYGLIGFYITLQGALQILDLGLSPTMSREMARYSYAPEKAGEARNLVRTLEIFYWAMSILIGIAVVLAAPLISTHWIRASSISVDTVQQVIILMGILTAIQWPISFYQGGLLGLQKQPLLNTLNVITSTLNNAGVVLVLWFLSSTLTAFFFWRICISVVQVSLNMFFLWRSLPASQHPPRFDAGVVKNIWSFSIGMSGIAISSIILMQLDKLILSKMLKLELFGYYTLACAVSNGLYMIIGPVFNTTFPRFTALAEARDEDTLRILYRKSSQLMSVIILPIATVVCFFSKEILMLWTSNYQTATNVAPILSILIIGTAINGLMNLPYALQLAYGWTRFGLYISLMLITIIAPGIYFMAKYYGSLGAASVWPFVNIVYMLFGVFLTHRYLLKGEAVNWFINMFWPFISVTTVVFLIKIMTDTDMTQIKSFIVVSFAISAALIAAVMSATHIRHAVYVSVMER